jgi:hypothetical protein
MKRREFITLLGGAAAAWPLAARAQQGERTRRIGVLMSAADDREGQARLAVFLQGLERLGWTVGRNVHLDLRWGAGRRHQHPQIRGGIGGAHAGGRAGSRQLDRRAVAAGNELIANRVRSPSRSRRQWLRRKPGAAGRQRQASASLNLA